MVQHMLHWFGFKCFIPHLVHGLVEDGRGGCKSTNTSSWVSLPADNVVIIMCYKANFKLFGHFNKHTCVYWDVTDTHINGEAALNQPGMSVSGIPIHLMS